jgi:transposase-like protein
MKNKKKEERPVISFRVNKELKDKILSVYGDFRPLEHIVEEHFLGNITPPSAIGEDNKMIKLLEKQIMFLTNVYENNIKHIQKLENKNKQINNKIKDIETEIDIIKQKDNEIKKNVELCNLETQDRITHSIHEVTRILEENKKQRELRPTKPVDKKVIKLYSDNCNMSLHKFMEYIPSDLHKCIK